MEKECSQKNVHKDLENELIIVEEESESESESDIADSC